ncbi:hypothetical protein K438DRAFT_1872427 [Mycena galopus ATCC 62051]|nr:hypothetical protein K438DRAFT_1872427 [Mycena galopus ATCC 62051]
MTTISAEALAPFFAFESERRANGCLACGATDSRRTSTGPVASVLFSQTEALGSAKGDDHLGPHHRDIGGMQTRHGRVDGALRCRLARHEHRRLHRYRRRDRQFHAPPEHADVICHQHRCHPTGLCEMFGTDTKSFHVGCAAQNGRMAAVLAARVYQLPASPRRQPRLGARRERREQYGRAFYRPQGPMGARRVSQV